MSHPEQLAFLRAVVQANTSLVIGGKVLEIGSYDVNGSVRSLFAECGGYVGVDLMDGPGVDLVSYGHDLQLPDGSFDVAASAECFEHDQHWPKTFTNMVRMTRPGGVVAMTCAARGRPEHGTRRTRLDESPGTQALGLDYYRNLTEQDFTDNLSLADWFDVYRFWTTRHSFDLYFAGVVKGGREPTGRLPMDDAVVAIDSMMPQGDRLIRLPLRAVSAVVPRDERYQDLILGYWRGVQKMGRLGLFLRCRAKWRRLMRRE